MEKILRYQSTICTEITLIDLANMDLDEKLYRKL